MAMILFLAELGLIQFTVVMVLMNFGADQAMTRSMAIMITIKSTVAMEPTL